MKITDSQIFDESELSLLNPPIRFDFDPGSYVGTKHPSAHMHVGPLSGGRIPVRRVLTPLAFTLFILKNFYSHEWVKFEDEVNKGDGFIYEFDRHLAQSKNECSLLDKEYFSDNEERLPYLD